MQTKLTPRSLRTGSACLLLVLSVSLVGLSLKNRVDCALSAAIGSLARAPSLVRASPLRRLASFEQRPANTQTLSAKDYVRSSSLSLTRTGGSLEVKSILSSPSGDSSLSSPSSSFSERSTPLSRGNNLKINNSSSSSSSNSKSSRLSKFGNFAKTYVSPPKCYIDLISRLHKWNAEYKILERGRKVTRTLAQVIALELDTLDKGLVEEECPADKTTKVSNEKAANKLIDWVYKALKKLVKGLEKSIRDDDEEQKQQQQQEENGDLIDNDHHEDNYYDGELDGFIDGSNNSVDGVDVRPNVGEHHEFDQSEVGLAADEQTLVATDTNGDINGFERQVPDELNHPEARVNEEKKEEQADLNAAADADEEKTCEDSLMHYKGIIVKTANRMLSKEFKSVSETAAYSALFDFVNVHMNAIDSLKLIKPILNLIANSNSTSLALKYLLDIDLRNSLSTINRSHPAAFLHCAPKDQDQTC